MNQLRCLYCGTIHHFGKKAVLIRCMACGGNLLVPVVSEKENPAVVDYYISGSSYRVSGSSYIGASGSFINGYQLSQLINLSIPQVGK